MDILHVLFVYVFSICIQIISTVTITLLFKKSTHNLEFSLKTRYNLYTNIKDVYFYLHIHFFWDVYQKGESDMAEKSPSLVTQAYETIKENIMNLTYPPGMVLTEAMLTKELG